MSIYLIYNHSSPAICVWELYLISIHLSLGDDFVNLSCCLNKYRHRYLNLKRLSGITSLLSYIFQPNLFLNITLGGWSKRENRLWKFTPKFTTFQNEKVYLVFHLDSVYKCLSLLDDWIEELVCTRLPICLHPLGRNGGCHT